MHIANENGGNRSGICSIKRKLLKRENSENRNGLRTFEFIVDLTSVDKIPMIVEPMFQAYDAKIEIRPVMVFSDLKKAIPKKK